MKLLKQTYPTAAAIIVAVIFGLSFLFTKDVLAYLAPFQLMGLRFTLAVSVMGLLIALRAVKLNIKAADLPDLLKIAVFQPALYFVFETYGVKFTTVSESSIIIALAPVLITVLSIFMLGEKINGKQFVCIGAAVVGVTVMVLGGNAEENADNAKHLLGLLLLIGAVVTTALYNVLSRRAAAKHSPLDITFIMMLVGAVIFNLLGIVQSYLTGAWQNYVKVLHNSSALMGLLFLGILSSVAAFFLLNYALSKLPAPRVAVFLNLIPVVAVAAGMLVYGEHLSLRQLSGGMLILLGVWGTNALTAKADEAKNAVSNTDAV